MRESLLVCGDSTVELRYLDDNTFHGGVIDPPYEINQAGASWDRTGVAFSVSFWAEVLRVCRPGAHLAVFGHARRAHRLAVALEDAGWELRDTLMWVYSTGMPMSVDATKAIDELLGTTAARPVVGTKRYGKKDVPQTLPASQEALAWSGYGTGLAPSYEPILLVRKPLQGTIAQNLLKWGTGAIHVDACRTPSGAWPKNTLLSDESVQLLQERHRPLYYCAKVSMQEREFGCEQLPVRSAEDITGRKDGSAGADNPRAGTGRSSGRRNYHLTVKPVQLLRWLTRLVAPKDAFLLDPFMGSGSAGMAAMWEDCDYCGIEQDAGHHAIAEARIAAAQAIAPPDWA